MPSGDPGGDADEAASAMEHEAETSDMTGADKGEGEPGGSAPDGGSGTRSGREAGSSGQFPRRMRLTHARQYERVYDAKLRKSRGPLTLFGAENSLPHPRLGLSIGRKVGGAVARNRLKRMIREAFRLSCRQFPGSPGGGFDWVVAARAHEPATLDEYRLWLLEAATAVARECAKRRARAGESQ